MADGTDGNAARELFIPAAAPATAEPEFKLWRSLDGKTVLIRVGYTELELTSAAALRLALELSILEAGAAQ